MASQTPPKHSVGLYNTVDVLILYWQHILISYIFAPPRQKWYQGAIDVTHCTIGPVGLVFLLHFILFDFPDKESLSHLFQVNSVLGLDLWHDTNSIPRNVSMAEVDNLRFLDLGLTRTKIQNLFKIVPHCHCLACLTDHCVQKWPWNNSYHFSLPRATLLQKCWQML